MHYSVPKVAAERRSFVDVVRGRRNWMTQEEWGKGTKGVGRCVWVYL